MDIRKTSANDIAASTHFCGRCTLPVHACATQCEHCRLDFNGAGRFQRLDCRPPASMLRALLDELCNETWHKLEHVSIRLRLSRAVDTL